MPLVAVVGAPTVLAPSVMVVPSTTIDSLAPSWRPLTVKSSSTMPWPASIVLVFAPEKTGTAAACVPTPAASVKVGFVAVALNVGASFTGVTCTVWVTKSVSAPPLPVLPVFKWFAEQGGIAELELLRTFNCGIGMITIVKPDAVEEVTEVLASGGESVALLGEVIPANGEHRVVYNGHLDLTW